jgi:dienelactone hydrolase
VKTQTVEYSSGKVRSVGYLTWDETQEGPRPGVIVFPEAFGLNGHARVRVDRLARLGYVALGADILGEGAIYNDMARLGPAIGALYNDRAEWRARVRGAYDALMGQSMVDRNKTAAIGFCFGGTCCVELARTGVPLSAISTFHSGLVAELPEDAGKIRARILVCHGDKDPLVKREHIDAFMTEMRRDNVDWQFNYYGVAAHSFTDETAGERGNPAFAYSKLSEDRSWAAMRHLFEEVFATS